MAPRVDGPTSSSIQDSGNNLDRASTTSVRLGESNLGQVADRLGVDKDDLLLANPQIKDPSKLMVGQDIHLPDRKTSTKAHSDDGSQTGKTDDKNKGVRLYGDPVDAGAMKGKLDDAHGGHAKSNGASDIKYADHHLPPDEQAMKDVGGDTALKAYQQFKQVQADLQRKLHELRKPEIMEKIKMIDQLEAAAANTRSPLERNAMLRKSDELRQDPGVQYELMMRDMQRNQDEMTRKMIESMP
jgi:hypothetical protein